MPQNKTTILSTRPLGKGLTEEAAAMDIVIDALSFIETEGVQDPDLDQRIRELSRESRTVVFTSMNAVDAVTSSLQRQQQGPAQLASTAEPVKGPMIEGIRPTETPGSDDKANTAEYSGSLDRTGVDRIPWAIYCIGAATRQRVQDYFGMDSIVGTAPSAGELANVIIRDGKTVAGASAGTDGNPGAGGGAGDRNSGPGETGEDGRDADMRGIGDDGRDADLRGMGEDDRNSNLRNAAGAELIFFCGDQRRDELPDQLRQAGIGIREIVVYRTRQTPHPLEKAYAGIAFFSPSAVHSFFSLNKVPPATVLFAIGRTTAAAIRQYSTNPTICSVSPEKDALIRLAMDHFRK